MTGARLELLKRFGFDRVDHDSHVPFMAHLFGTRRILAEWGSRPALCDAGLFHSAYGTEYYQPDDVPDRASVAVVIGDEAERIAWLWCVIERDRIDVERPCAPDRRSGELIELEPRQLGDIATLWCADTAEQIARMEVHERGFAASIMRVLPFASAPARSAVAAVLPLVDEHVDWLGTS